MLKRKILILSLLVLALLSACGSNKHPAAQSVEALLQALVDKDEAGYLAHTCQEYETGALLELDSFSMVSTRLEGLDCQVAKEDGDNATVTCQGQIVATYGMEDQVFELKDRVYQVSKRDGEWLVCGY